MSTSKLDSNGDWNFGQSLANYITGSEEIAQNVLTRLKSFKYDWFLDESAEIDWFTILGSLGNQETIKREVSRVTGETEGVSEVTSIELIEDRETRKASVIVNYLDVYNVEQTTQASIGI